MTPPMIYPPTLRIAILVFPDFEPLDVWGFCEAFSIARFLGTSYGDPPPYPFEIVLVSTETRPLNAPTAVPQPVRSYNGPRVAPDMFRDDALAGNFDVLMIPGGQGVAALLSRNAHPHSVAALIQWVQQMDARVPLLTSVCTGAAVLAAAGMLDDQPAATNHQAFAWVAQFGPRVRWDNVRRWVDAGTRVTSAGVSAGTDMAFYLVARLAGRAVAEAAARAAEYDWHRDPETPISYSA
jgi:transcriptional regulator GlxA family with amidase domain